MEPNVIKHAIAVWEAFVMSMGNVYMDVCQDNLEIFVI
jgi:hypothetical protein